MNADLIFSTRQQATLKTKILMISGQIINLQSEIDQIHKAHKLEPSSLFTEQLEFLYKKINRLRDEYFKLIPTPKWN